MSSYEKALLINLVGHAAGTLIFGMFLALFLRDRAGSRLRGSRLTIMAAALALIWNAGSLAGTLITGQEQEDSPLATLAFCALSLLPAVLLHISLQHRMAALRITAYVLSGAAVALHVFELWTRQAELHRAGLLVITMGFGILTLVSAVAALLRGGTAAGSRLLGAMSLALFAMSFAHFGAHSGVGWFSELFIHHAGLPLAVFVLLQDYRFLLVDAFLRFVVAATLAGSLAMAALRFPIPGAPGSGLRHGLTLGLFAAAMLLFAVIHAAVQDFLTRTVFRRPDSEEAANRLRTGGPTTSEQEYLEWCAAQLAIFLRTERVEAADLPDACGNPSPHPISDHLQQEHGYPDWVEAVAPLGGGSPKHLLLLFGRRAGGRRYLSEDYVFLGQMANVIVERLAEFRQREMQRLVSEAELQALQTQINPHFLFNTLNTIYGTIPRTSPEARKMVRNLSDIFRYSLQAGVNTVPLEREMDTARAYLEIEQLRFGDRMRVEIHVEPDAAQRRIPALTVQPLVENAVRHAIAVNPEGGVVRVSAHVDPENALVMQVSDSGPGATQRSSQGTGIGIANVRRRLELCHGAGASIVTAFAPDGGSVTIRVPHSI